MRKQAQLRRHTGHLLGAFVALAVALLTSRASHAAAIEGASDYRGAWEYRWGEAAGDAGFTPLAKVVQSPPSRNGQRFLWLRTRLDGPDYHDATLYLEIVDQIFEAYLDGKRIYVFGDLDGTRRFLGYPVHYLPLGSDSRGRTLTLRIYSDHINIGLSGQVRLGSKSRLIIDALQRDMGKIIVGWVLCAIGIFAIVLFLNQRREWAYLYYATFVLGAGVWILCQMRVRCLIIDRPLLWTHVEFFALYTAVAGLVLFLTRAMGRGPFGLMPILGRIYVLYDLGAALLVATGIVGIMATLLPFQLLMALGILYTLCQVAILLRKGNFEAWLFALGLAASTGFSSYDLMAALGLLPRVVLAMSHFGHGAFAVALGLILIHRFRLVHSDLVTTKQALSDKLSALEQRNTEVEQLNDELRHQIEARSKNLVSSLLGDASSSQEAPPIFEAGTQLGERYRVVRMIGQGAMGVVYEVERVQDGRHLAAKVLSGRAHRRDLARFAREAQVLARLKHRNLVTIVDVDVTDNRLAYIVMELVDGTTLAEETSQYGQLDFVLPVLRQIADALAMVHAEGVVHRDLKPANILITRAAGASEPMIKLVDFGVSGLSAADLSVQAMADTAPGDRAADLLTQTGVIMGTPLYMAPELVRGAKLARAAADIFSFGIIAYELLSGERPSEVPPIMMLIKPQQRWYTSLPVRCPALPADLVDLVEQCLDAVPENRPSAAKLHAFLRAMSARRAASSTEIETSGAG